MRSLKKNEVYPMQEYIQKIEGWMDQVKDEETDIEDYDFLEDAVTGGKTLGNIGSYLAVYEREGEVYVDDDLLEALDQKKTEIARDESSSPGHIKKERTNQGSSLWRFKPRRKTNAKKQ